MHGRAEVAEHRSLAAGEHSSHPPSLEREVSVADGIDAAVNPVQPAGVDSASDRVVREACGEELGNRDHAVLAARKTRDPTVRTGFGGFLAHMTGKPPKPLACPPRQVNPGGFVALPAHPTPVPQKAPA
jgi:hypothetical protein